MSDLEMVTTVLRQISIPANLNGYRYLQDAICLVMSDQSYLHNITKRLYLDIATHYESTPARVERSIRHAIDVGYSHGDKEILERYIGPYRNKRPTNSEFIAAIADYLKIEKSKG